MLNKIAAILAALTACIHAFAGGADALKPMLASGLSNPAEGAMHACWHFVTAFFLISVYVFWRGEAASRAFALLWIIFGVIFIYVGFAQSGLSGLKVNPQWTILSVTGVLGLWGARTSTARAK